MKESHKNSTTKALASVFLGLLASGAISADDVDRRLTWHLEDATYGAFMVFGESGSVHIWEICGTKSEKEVFDLIATSGPKFRPEDALIVFAYEKHLKQIRYGNKNDKYTSRIVYRSSTIDGKRIFPDFGAKTIEEMVRIFEEKYLANIRLVTE